MNILQINNYHRVVGGSDSVFFSTSELLESAGHRVVPFAAAGDGDRPSPYSGHFPAGLEPRAAHPRDLPRYIYNRDAARALAELVEGEGPFDLAHLHIYYGRLTTAILPELKRRGIPVVQSLHEYKLACPVYTMVRDGAVCDACVGGSTFNVLRHRCKDGSLLRSAVALTEFKASRMFGDVRLVDRFITLSAFQRDVMARAGIPAEKLATLHNFVDTDTYRPLPPEQKRDYLLYFGRIETLKGVPTLVRAARAAGVRLKLAGTGAWQAGLARAAADTPLIEPLGFLSGAPLRELIARARAVVVPSEWNENCPMAVLEAKASGTPVIGARIGGIPELVRDGVDGFLFEPGDREGLQGAIARLATADLAALSTAAVEDAHARFSPQAHYARLMDIYADAAGKV